MQTHPRVSRPVLAVLAALTLFANGSGLCAEKAAPGEDRETLSISTEEAMQPWQGDLDGMVKRGVIRVLTVYSKTFYFVDKAVQRGATYDMFRQFELDLNKKLAQDRTLQQKHLKVRVLFLPVSRDELLPALAAGKGDIAAANLTITPERQKQVGFSSPLYANASEVVVSGAGTPALSSAEDLAGKEVFVRKSSSYRESLTALNKRFVAEKRPRIVIKEAPEALEDEDLIEMVNAGLLPLIIVDQHKAAFWQQVFPGIRINEKAAVRTGGNIAWALRKDSPQLKTAVDDFLARHRQGTAIGNEIITRYLKNTKYVKNATSEAERRKFLALIEYFRKYGDEYDVDWLLMVAQGYQESQLNQAARSKAGAIGVMQLLPSTGKDLGVGDITQIEPNIHAGIKYMRWMIDNYYDKEPMSSLDKTLFAFASYNAGAGRVAQLRREAAKRGLNPNVWFHNVEYIAAEKVGAETVSYVSNIYKYYIAYSLMMEAREEKAQATKKFKGK